MKIHKLNLENYYRNAIDSAIAKMNGLPEAIFAGRPTYNEAALKFSASETPVLALPQWAQFTIDLTKDKPSWAPASGSLKATFSASVSGVEAGDTMDLDSEKVYGASVTATAKQYTVNEGRYTVVIQANILNGDNEVVLSYTSNAMKVAMTKEADNGPDTTLDIDQVGSFTQEQADWNQSDNTKVDYIKNKPTIPTVNDATLTFTQDGETLATFSANASTNVEVEIPAGGGGGASIIETTWSALKALRDGGTLTPGQQYRITDYVATTSTNQTQSGNHPFDIIVTADSASKLNEHARAILHSGDTYFANCKLEAWKLWYCLDNDTARFEWADSTNGKGVVYRMIDEFDNDGPYDFKNIIIQRPHWANNYSYLFGSISSEPTDGSKEGTCYKNTVESIYATNGKTKLMFNSIYGWQNKVGKGCYGLILQNAGNNTFYQGCNNNTLGLGTSYNVFESGCSSNTVGNNSSYNRFCNNASSNNIGVYSSYNQISGNFVTFGTYSGYSASTKNYYHYIIVEPGVSYVNLNCTENDLGSARPYKNVKICSGISGTSSSRVTITDSNFNQSYQTTFFNETDGTLKKQEGSTVTAYTPPA